MVKVTNFSHKKLGTGKTTAFGILTFPKVFVKVNEAKDQNTGKINGQDLPILNI